MTRLRYNGLSTTLGGSGLASGATTAVTFAAALTYNGGTAVPTIAGSDYIPLSILDSAGKLAEVVNLTAYTSGATTGTIARAQEGTSAAARAAGLKVVQAPTTLDVVGTGLLAAASYKAATDTGLSTASTTFVDAQVALAVTFTAPASGAVIVERNAYVDLSASGSQYWNLRNATGDISGTDMRVAGTASGPRVSAKQRITGLTPGTSYTWKWGFRTFNAAQTVYILTGPTNGTAEMFVYDGTTA